LLELLVGGHDSLRQRLGGIHLAMELWQLENERVLDRILYGISLNELRVKPLEKLHLTFDELVPLYLLELNLSQLVRALLLFGLLGALPGRPDGSNSGLIKRFTVHSHFSVGKSQLKGSLDRLFSFIFQ
jgi:hypothetical protein